MVKRLSTPAPKASIDLCGRPNAPPADSVLSQQPPSNTVELHPDRPDSNSGIKIVARSRSKRRHTYIHTYIHTHAEFVDFLKLVAKAYPRVKLHVVADN